MCGICNVCKSVNLLSCCLFIIDAVLATSVFANYPTHIQAHTNTKSTKTKDIALAEKLQDKQHPTSKLRMLFLVSTSTSPNFPSYLCFFSYFLSPAPISFLILYFISFMSLLSHMLPALCSLSLPSPCPSLPPTSPPFTHHSSSLNVPIQYRHPPRVSNLFKTNRETTVF